MNVEMQQYKACYLEFLNKLISRKKEASGLSFSNLSLKAGFSSRNYLREVLLGKKMPRPESLTKILSITKASSLEKKYCRLLHLRAFDCDRFTLKQQTQLDAAKDEIEGVTSYRIDFNSVYSKEQIPIVIAAVGSDSKYSPIQLIAMRCGISESNLLPILEELQEKQIVFEKEGAYKLANQNMICDHLGGSEAFHYFFMNGLERSRLRAKKDFQNRKNLFFQTNFTIKKDSLMELREILRQTVLDFIDENHAEEGDTVAKLNVSFFD